MKPATAFCRRNCTAARRALHARLHRPAGGERSVDPRSAPPGARLLQGARLDGRGRVRRCGTVRHDRQPPGAAAAARIWPPAAARRSTSSSSIPSAASCAMRSCRKCMCGVSPRRASGLSASRRTWATIPIGVMVRQVFALFDEYQSNENAQARLRARCKENARQGFWNGAAAPYGYTIVAAEQRGAQDSRSSSPSIRSKPKIVRLMFRLCSEGDGTTGPMGVKAAVCWLNERGYRTRGGARWGIGPLHKPAHQHRSTRASTVFNRKVSKTRKAKPTSEQIVVPVDPIIDPALFDAAAGAAEGPQSEGHAAARRHRPDPADRHCHLRQLRRRHDAAHRQVGPLSLLHLRAPARRRASRPARAAPCRWTSSTMLVTDAARRSAADPGPRRRASARPHGAPDRTGRGPRATA